MCFLCNTCGMMKINSVGNNQDTACDQLQTWHSIIIHQGPVVQRMDNAIRWINHYPGDNVVCFVNTYLLDSDLSGG